MKQTKTKMVWLVICLGVGAIGLCAEPFAKGLYLGQTPPGPIAKVFAPGLICHIGAGPRRWEAFGTFSADGNTFCFQRVIGVFITENTDQGWTTPKRIKSIPANTYAPWSACLSADANSIYFTRALVNPMSKRNLYRCDRTANAWTAPQALGAPFSSPAKELTCSLSANNNIYIGSTRKRKPGKGGIWVVPCADNTWPRDEHVTLNFPAGDSGIAPDESFMVFTHKDLPGGYGHMDIYLTLHLPDGTWSKPRNLGPRINTIYIEHGPRISPDKKYLFFNRSTGWDPRINAGDICWVELKEYLPESYR
jgi:hypothetical protein